MAQVLLDGTEQDRIEALVTEFDPASRPGPLRDRLSGDDLEIMRDYVAEEIRGRIGAKLLARASVGKLEPSQGWVNPFEDQSSAVLFDRHRNAGLMDATFELVYAAEAAMFAE